ncbi:MAG: response regulator [Propioniciclava sp.]
MTSPRRHRVLVVDDDAVVRDAYRMFFAAEDRFTLVGESPGGQAGVEDYRHLRPDIVLMDLNMPDLSGIEATREITADDCRACVVAMTTFTAREYVVAALEAGAAGYLVKGISASQLAAGLLQAAAGDMPLSAMVRRELVATVTRSIKGPVPDGSNTLPPRELELVHLLAAGLTNRQIARRMHLSEGTIKQYVARVADKLQASSRTQILIRAIQAGLVDPFTVTDPAGSD